MNPELAEAREELLALPDDAAHALDPEPGPAPADLPPGAPPPPPFVLPEHLAGKPDAALRQAQDAALAAGLSPEQANAAGRAAAEYVLAHGTSPETAHKRELLRGIEAGLPPDEAVRLAREAGDRAAAAREAARAPQPVGPPAIPFGTPPPEHAPPFTAPSAEPTPEVGRESPPFAIPPPAVPEQPPPFVLPLPEPPATAPGPGEGAGVNPVPAPGPAPGFEPSLFAWPVLGAEGPPPAPAPAADAGHGGAVPPWWDPFLGDVVGAVPEPATPPWWDPMLGQVVEPGTATRRPTAPAEAAGGPPGHVPSGIMAGLAEAEEEARAEEPPGPAEVPRGETRRGGRDSPFGGDPFSYAGRVLGRGLDELLGPGGDYGPQGGGETAGGGMMELLTRIAEGVQRLVDLAEQRQEAGGASGGWGPARAGGFAGAEGVGEDYTAASPSIDTFDLFRPGQELDAAGRTLPERPKRQRQRPEHPED